MISIKKALIFGLGIIVLFLLGQFAVVWWGKQSISEQVVSIAQKNTLAFTKINDLAIVAQQIRRYEKEFFIYVNNANSKRRADYVKEWTDTSVKMQNLLKSMRANEDGAFNKADVEKMAAWSDASDFYISEMKGIFASVETGEDPTKNNGVVRVYVPAEVNLLIADGKDRLSRVLLKGVSEMTKAKAAENLTLSSVAESGFSRLLRAVAISTSIGILIALILLFTLPRLVTRPIEALSKQVDDLSRGKFDTKPDHSTLATEFDLLAKAIERMGVAQQMLIARMQRQQTIKPAD